MRIGMVILAARGGTIIGIEQSFSNSTTLAGEENFLTIEHDDGTVAIYLHFSPDSLAVNLGDTVNQGDFLGLSGDSGFTGFNNPHLHFEVTQSDSVNCTLSGGTQAANGGVINLTGCKSVPVTFRNAQPNDTPLIETRSYTALPF